MLPCQIAQPGLCGGENIDNIAISDDHRMMIKHSRGRGYRYDPARIYNTINVLLMFWHWNAVEKKALPRQGFSMIA